MLDEQISRPPRTPEGPPVVVAAGDIDLAVAPSLRESLAELLDAGHCDIVVDLIDATFLDSVALGVLVGALEQCRQAGGDLHLVVTDPRIPVSYTHLDVYKRQPRDGAAARSCSPKKA